MEPTRRSVASFLASFLVAVFLAGGLAAQGTAQRTDELALHAYAFKYRQASEALPLVSPLLSQRGTVELQPATNTLVIRDTNGALNKILPVLRSYDRPARALTMDLYIVRASRSAVPSAAMHSNLPPSLAYKLRALFTYDNFDVQAQAQLTTVEGQSVTYRVGDDYRVSFRNGTLSANQELSVADLRILRRTNRRAMAPLIYYKTMSLQLEQPTTLGLARNESSPDALLFVMILRSKDPAHRLQKVEP